MFGQAQPVRVQARRPQPGQRDGCPTLAGEPATVANAVDQGAKGAEAPCRGQSVRVLVALDPGQEFEMATQIGVASGLQGSGIPQFTGEDCRLDLVGQP